MKFYLTAILLSIINILFSSCEEEEPTGLTATSLKVFHGAVDGPKVHINYFGRPITFFANPTLAYMSYERYTLPADTEREISIINAEDTLSQILSTSVSLSAGKSATLFLTGRDQSLDAWFLPDDFVALTDSLVGVRFINLSPDSDLVSVSVAGETSNLVEGLTFKYASEYIPLSATVEDGSYSFEFKDDEGNVLASSTLDPLPAFGIQPLFKNLTLVLVGLTGDGSGGNSLSVRQINHF